MIDARAYLQSLVGTEIRTLTNQQPNRILRIEGDDVIVGTGDSPDGQPVRSSITVESLGHRGAFIGAVPSTLHGAVVEPTTPRRVWMRAREKGTALEG